jgi:hypothetical protein
MPAVFTRELPEGKTLSFWAGFSFDIPTADQVTAVLDGLPDRESVEFRMTAWASARAFFSKMEMELILRAWIENTFEINEVDRWYDLVLEALPELQKKLKKQWWNLIFSSFGGPPWTAVITTITISPIEK